MIAEGYIRRLDQAKVFDAPIVTQVVPLTPFYPAEEHHQNYCNHHPTDRYVQEVAMSKVEKAKKQTPELLKK